MNIQFSKTILLILFIIIVTFYPPQQNAQDKQEKTGHDFQQLNVVNKEVVLRVFNEKQPVKGLKKQDFKIFENGQEVPINGFYIKEKEIIKSTSHQSVSNKKSIAKLENTKPRFILLIFNFSDFNLELEKIIDFLFEKIFLEKDYIMVVTGGFIMQQHQILNLKKEKKHMRKLLDMEAKRMKRNITRLESELRILGNDFLTSLKTTLSKFSSDRERTVENFYRDYRAIFQQFRARNYDILLEEYAKIAWQFTNIKQDKWVLCFYQMGRFPRLRQHGPLAAQLNRYPILKKFARLKKIEFEMDFLQNIDEWMTKQVSHVFLNTGATFHTIMMKAINSEKMELFKYDNITTDAENTLRQLTRKTGGRTVFSNDVKKFEDILSKHEDIQYILTFVPQSHQLKNTKIKITLPQHPNYRLVYDNNKLSKSMQKVIEKIALKNPQFKIDKLFVQQGVCYAQIKNIHLLEDKSKSIKKSELKALLVVLDKNGKKVFEIKKIFLSKKTNAYLGIKLPPLPTGHYEFILEATELATVQSFAMAKRLKVNNP